MSFISAFSNLLRGGNEDSNTPSKKKKDETKLSQTNFEVPTQAPKTYSRTSSLHSVASVGGVIGGGGASTTSIVKSNTNTNNNAAAPSTIRHVSLEDNLIEDENIKIPIMANKLLTHDDFYLEPYALPAYQSGKKDSIHGFPAPSVPKDARFYDIVQSVDITRITDRILACGLVWSSASAKYIHRNNIKDLATFLDTRYPGKYMIWNLAGGTAQAAYEKSYFNNQVLNFGLSKAYQMSLKTLLDVCRSIHAWLNLDKGNVAVIHCTNGVGKTGVAISCYLRFSEIFSDANEAFDYFIRRRTPDDNQWPTVSQRRYVQYMNNILLLNGSVPNPYALQLHRIILNGVPNYDDLGSCYPGIEIYQSSRLVYNTVFKPHKEEPTEEELEYLPVYKDKEVIIFRVPEDLNLALDRDIQIRVYHVPDPVSAPKRYVTMINFSFHTGFMPPGMIRVALEDLEISKKDLQLNRFESDFSMDFILDETAIEDTIRPGHLKALSYYRVISPKMEKCMPKLIRFHTVQPNDNLLAALQKIGCHKMIASLALQRVNNEQSLVYQFVSDLLNTSKEVQKLIRKLEEEQKPKDDKYRSSLKAGGEDQFSETRSIDTSNRHSTARSADSSVSFYHSRPDSTYTVESNDLKSATANLPISSSMMRNKTGVSQQKLQNQNDDLDSHSIASGGRVNTQSPLLNVYDNVLNSTNPDSTTPSSPKSNLHSRLSDGSVSTSSTSYNNQRRSSSGFGSSSSPFKSGEKTNSNFTRGQFRQDLQSVLDTLRSRSKITGGSTSSDLDVKTSKSRTRGGESLDNLLHQLDSIVKDDSNEDLYELSLVSDTSNQPGSWPLPPPRILSLIEGYEESQGKRFSGRAGAIGVVGNGTGGPGAGNGSGSGHRGGSGRGKYAGRYGHDNEEEEDDGSPVKYVMGTIPTPPKAESPDKREPKPIEPPAGGPPPPPPPPMTGGPPPPPPPPGQPGAPSPPMMMMYNDDPNKARVRAKLHWNEIKNIKALKGTIWTEIDGHNGKRRVASGIALDVKRFEELFCVVPDDKKTKAKPKLISRQQFAQVLDHRRSQNVAIGLSRFTRRGLDTPKLIDAIARMDESLLSSDDLLTLQNLLPTMDERILLKNYQTKPKEEELPFAPAEEFMYAIMEVKDFAQMIVAFIFKLQLNVEVEELQDKCARMNNTCVSLRESEKLKLLLKSVLELGNMTNYDYGAGSGGSYRPWMGQQAKALGFKIDGLARLKDVKSADGKWNLMNFLADMVYRSKPAVLDVCEEFKDIKIIRQYDVKDISKQLKTLTNTCEQLRKHQFLTASFGREIAPFLDRSEKDLDNLIHQYKSLYEVWIEAAKYLGEDMEEYNQIYLPGDQGDYIGNKKLPSHLFVTMSAFFMAFEESAAQNKKRREDEEKRKIREQKSQEDKEKRAALKKAREEASCNPVSATGSIGYLDSPGSLANSPNSFGPGSNLSIYKANSNDTMQQEQQSEEPIEEPVRMDFQEVPDMMKRFSVLDLSSLPPMFPEESQRTLRRKGFEEEEVAEYE